MRQDIRWVTKEEFERVLQLAFGQAETPAHPEYPGVWYRRSDGVIVGVRKTLRYGLMIEFIQSSNEVDYPPGMRFVRK